MMRDVEAALRTRLQDPHPAVVAGAAKGLDSLIRNTGKVQSPEPDTVSQLRAATTVRSDRPEGDFALARRLAWLALAAAGPVDVATVERGYGDPDFQVRRRVIAALATTEAPDAQRRALLSRALRDAAFQVRYEAVRTYSRTLQAQDCAPVISAIDDPSTHVSLAAIDALGDGCPAGPSPVARLVTLSNELQKLLSTPDPGSRIPDPGFPSNPWHRPAHALAALARVAREQGTERMPAFADHPVWQVRVYAARAAAALADVARLERLAADADDNVRHAALEGLRPLRKHEADAIYIDALGRRDYQLVMFAAQSLEGSPDGATAAPALLKAFARLTDERRDTSRDPRMAILARLRELGSQVHAPALRSCVNDQDRVVAAECAATLWAWTGTAPALPPAPARSEQAVVRVPVRVRMTMRRAGVIEMRLFPEDAPATAARFVHLARQGYYNGLSFWRVVPGFVLQGGSPGSNEYWGDGPFMRDELGLRSHLRGTIGLSTRGRNTGDAQIFVNLLDNPRLDHEYTVFGEITSGMEVADGILEGDIIERVDVLGG
jgi:cyclophilin family peptidyl-prolyl cis-trans isomerase/HEAT repeat protein